MRTVTVADPLEAWLSENCKGCRHGEAPGTAAPAVVRFAAGVPEDPVPTREAAMTWLRARASSALAVLLVLGLASTAPRVAAQASPAAAPASPAPSASPERTRPQKSVYGTMTAIDKSLNGVAMKTNDGKRLAWRFPPRVIAQIVNFKVGDPMIVIYRQIASNEKRVTAVAFPGSAATPIYVNTTGSRVIVRTGPKVDGECGQPEAGPISESVLPADGLAEVQEACWCCAVSGESCTPGNKSGNGRAFLVSCFK